MIRSSQTSHRIPYRPDIDGLRAVAIFLVVAAHARLPGFAGGFVGVDVFFVLSGFLITLLLVREAACTGTIDLPAFFARRLRRLLPALACMLVLVSFAGALLLAPVEHVWQASSAIAASAWVSNLLFAFQNVEYFGQDAGTNLFLHTWSLGVEEQFYLVWPLFVMIFGGLLAKRRAFEKARLRIALAGALLASFFLAVLLTGSRPMWAFYLMPARAWQFAFGGLLALLVQERFGADGKRAGHPAPPSSRSSTLFGWVGLALIVGSSILLDQDVAYPGTLAVFPSLGAVLVLLGCATGGRSLRALLGSRPMSFIGRVSYSWYLWHWPVLLLGEALGITQLHGRIALGIVSLLIAVLSLHAIETPIRGQRLLAMRSLGSLASGAATIAICVPAAYWWHKVASDWWQHDPVQASYTSHKRKLPVIYAMGCDEYFLGDRARICGFGNPGAENVAVLVGDSLMGQWFPAVAPIYTDDPDWRLLVITKSACPMVDESFFYSRIKARYVACERWRANALAAIETLNPDVVLVGSSTGYPFDREQWVGGTRRVLERISRVSGAVLVFRATPRLPFDGPRCLARNAWRPAVLASHRNCQAPVEHGEDEDIYGWIQQAAEGLDNAHVLDASSLVCPDGICKAERDGYVVFRDRRHLSAEFVASLTDELGAMLDRRR